VLHRSGRATARIQVATHIMCGCALPHPPILHSCAFGMPRVTSKLQPDRKVTSIGRPSLGAASPGGAVDREE
jgi:hypothetical protein